MSEMIERVAREIAKEDAVFDGNPNPIRYSDKFWQKYEPEARAAIAAMREPTEAMVRRGGCELDLPNLFMGGASERGKFRACNLFKTMIDEALK